MCQCQICAQSREGACAYFALDNETLRCEECIQICNDLPGRRENSNKKVLDLAEPVD